MSRMVRRTPANAPAITGSKPSRRARGHCEVEVVDEGAEVVEAGSVGVEELALHPHVAERLHQLDLHVPAAGEAERQRRWRTCSPRRSQVSSITNFTNSSQPNVEHMRRLGRGEVRHHPRVLEERSPTRASRAPASLMPYRRRPRLHRLDDSLVAGAPAEVARQPLPDLVEVGFGLSSRNACTLTHEAGRAEPALEAVGLAERLLHRAERAVGGADALDGGDVGAVGLHREHQARAHRVAVDRTVHAPHTPCSQPRCVPVRPQSSRRKSASVLRASTVPAWTGR